MTDLTEGLHTGDLKNMINPLISIDEYESKIDDSAIVIAFYVSDIYAAKDLNKFIQKSFVKLLDTEVSPAPDQQGNYLVFVELQNNTVFAENVKIIVDEVTSLCNIENWFMKIRGTEKQKFNKDILQKHFSNLNKNDLTENLKQFFFNSFITDMLVEDNYLYLNDELIGEILNFDDYKNVIVEQNITDVELDMSSFSEMECKKIENILGEGWSVFKIKNNLYIENSSTNNVLVIG